MKKKPKQSKITMATQLFDTYYSLINAHCGKNKDAIRAFFVKHELTATRMHMQCTKLPEIKAEFLEKKMMPQDISDEQLVLNILANKTVFCKSNVVFEAFAKQFVGINC
jgi:hypothetical protein